MVKVSSDLVRVPRVLPRALSEGARVGVFAPSLPLSSIFRDRLDFAVQQLGRALKVVPVLAENVTAPADGFCAGPAALRAKQLNAFIADESIEAVFCSIGGFNSAEILPLLDFELAIRHPKILVGYSDCTSLLLGLHAASGWGTFHGPAVMTQFGEFPAIYPYTLDCLERALRGGLVGELKQPDFWTEERLEWGDGSWKSRARMPSGTGEFDVWRAGQGEGVLWGGNLETVNMLAGTPYFAPPEEPIVLFWEAVEAEAFMPRVRRALVHLAQCGILDRTAAMLVGRSPDAKPFMSKSLRDTVEEVVKPYRFPILADLPLGHTDPLATLPIGTRARVDARFGAPQLFFLDEAVLQPRGSHL